MMIDPALASPFKNEVQSSGRKLFAQEKVFVSSATDTEIHASVRASPPVKVLLKAEGIGAPSFTASCSCPMGKKRQFCKHVWAAILAADENHPDFLASKRSVEKPDEPIEGPGEREEAANARQEAARARAAEYNEAAKARASEYRKERYLKQKERKKAEKRATSRPSTRAYGPEVEAALEYFSANGFPMPDGPDEGVLGEAKRKLSRVFHPDKGGAHAEIIELNRNYEILLRELR